MSKSRKPLTAALDIGTSKVCCLIAELGDDCAPRIIGIGHQVSKGIKGGSIVDMEAARNAVRAVVHTAEEMADATITGVVVNVSAGDPRSARTNAEVTVPGHQVSKADLRRLLDQGQQWRNGVEREVIHAIPVAFSLDGTRGIKDPSGMAAQRLGVDMHLVTAEPSAIQNLKSCVAGCHLECEALVASPYAAGLGCLTIDETELGVTIIDMGGGTTTLASFEEGELVFTGRVPVGGRHVSADLAHGLATPLADAERIKTLFGTAVATSSDGDRLIGVPQIAGDLSDEIGQASRAEIAGMIGPRIEETFELMAELIERDGPGVASIRRIILTGGASQLQGVAEITGNIFGVQVRLGRPAPITALAESVSGPAFAVAAGLLHYAMAPPGTGGKRASQHSPSHHHPSHHNTGSAGLFVRIGQWLHEYF
ncbi:MAG: cell division protein FtsA [Alphaproteobacteria bacterium]|nr:cell division protein FtsA [Alphaproteobacteria bacterium]